LQLLLQLHNAINFSLGFFELPLSSDNNEDLIFLAFFCFGPVAAVGSISSSSKNDHALHPHKAPQGLLQF
jgi:hypothetical protein